jgi:protein-S-isoprenylcysteine O-methyltransferase Ste14
MRLIIPPILFLMCLILMALLRWLWPIKMLFPMPWSLLGIVPIILGLISGFLGAFKFRSAGTNIRPFRDADKLVTTGPYRFTRNPMYLGLVLVLTGAWILMGALSPVIGVVIFVVTADRWYIRFEEKMLQQKFGAAFGEYRSKVRRWI